MVARLSIISSSCSSSVFASRWRASVFCSESLPPSLSLPPFVTLVFFFWRGFHLLCGLFLPQQQEQHSVCRLVLLGGIACGKRTIQFVMAWSVSACLCEKRGGAGWERQREEVTRGGRRNLKGSDDNLVACMLLFLCVGRYGRLFFVCA